jgi:mono/diheme cytochrome c family protein
MNKLLKSRVTRMLVAAVCVHGGTPLLLKAAAKQSNSATAANSGLAVFERRCAMCHYSDRVEKKMGPGLKGFYKRGKFITSGNSVTDESVKAWIQNGDSMMPPFKDVLDEKQLNNLIAYLRTL